VVVVGRWCRPRCAAIPRPRTQARGRLPSKGPLPLGWLLLPLLPILALDMRCDAMPCVCVALRCVGEGTTWRELPWNPFPFVFADEMGRATSSISVYGVPSYQRVGPGPRPGQPMDPSLVCNYRLFPSPNSTDEELTTALI
jgi:hypothetical protein